MSGGVLRWVGSIACLIVLSTGLSQGATWKEEFDRICAETVTATSLSAEQLRALVKDSDALLARLASVDDPGKKVYVMRLQKCRSFFLYMLGLKEPSPSAPGAPPSSP
ncbi:MAG: hypothetical protein HY899_00150 [Deltaproteobacteria bacterium]|nr:hypothetical protein [Deltaproteobacteria bacterium]